MKKRRSHGAGSAFARWPQRLQMRDLSTRAPFGWEFALGREVVPVSVTGPLRVNDVGSLLAACVGGHGVAQMLELFARDLLVAGRLIQLLPDCADETFPLCAFHHSARLQSAKVRAFLDFVVALTRAPLPSAAVLPNGAGVRR